MAAVGSGPIVVGSPLWDALRGFAKGERRYETHHERFFSHSGDADRIDPHRGAGRRSVHGRLVRVDGASLEICFKHTEPPAVGQLVQLLRMHYETPNKGPIRQMFTPDGHARIVSVATPPCVMATLLDG
jgi:hypothetical protein